MVGIYCITNNENNKRYIGQSKNILKRWNSHISDLENGSHRNRIIQQDFDRYGLESFSFTVMEKMDNIININEREQFWINKLRTYNEYNIAHSLYSNNKSEYIRYVPIELLENVNISTKRSKKDDEVSYITYEMAIGILNECHIKSSNTINISINKVTEMRGIFHRGSSTYNSSKAYFNQIADMKVGSIPIVENIKYDDYNPYNNSININKDLLKTFTFMPYNYMEYNSFKSCITKHIYLLINYYQLKLSNKNFSIPKHRLINIFNIKDDDVYSFNKKLKSSMEELKKDKVIMEFNILEDMIKITL